MSLGSIYRQEQGIELVDYGRKSSSVIMSKEVNGEQFSQEVYRASSASKEVKFRKKYRSIQRSVYMFLEKPSSWKSILYHTIVFFIILASLVLSIVTTIDQFEGNTDVARAVFYLEIILVATFSIEYLLRLWSSSSHGSYSGCNGKLKFARKPYMLIDIIVIIATLVLVVEQQKPDVLNVSVLRFLRFLQVLRILRLDRQRGAFKMVSNVIYSHRQELMTCWYMSFIILITCSFLVYLAEKSSSTVTDGKMANLADGLYWGIISLLTIGYGDLSPQTWVAKFLTCCFSLIGTAFFALPAGILGSGFALQVAQNQREKHFSNRRIPAAILIQNTWRRFAIDPENGLHATWIRFVKMTDKRKSKSPASSPAVSVETRRKSLMKKLQLVRTSSSAEKYQLRSNDLEPREEDNQMSDTESQLRTQRAVSDGDLTYIDPVVTEDENQSTVTSLPSIVFLKGVRKGLKRDSDLRVYRKELTPVERLAIRFILEVRFVASIKKFKEARRPYDVKDVIEQYTAGQIEMFGYIKKFQSRIETAFGIEDDAVEDASRSNVIKRLGQLERKAENMDRKLDLVIKMLHDSNKVRSDRASSFTNTRLSPDPGRSLETLEQKPPRGPAISRLKPKSKSSRFKVTIIDSRDSQDEK